jgi:hypothetical protein
MMYIKGTTGPIEVVLPDGTKLNRSNLPPKNTVRWVASRKLIIVQAVKHGLLSKDEACQDYDLSSEELESWIKHSKAHGPSALKVTAIPKYRQL